MHILVVLAKPNLEHRKKQIVTLIRLESQFTSKRIQMNNSTTTKKKKRKKHEVFRAKIKIDFRSINLVKIRMRSDDKERMKFTPYPIETNITINTHTQHIEPNLINRCLSYVLCRELHSQTAKWKPVQVFVFAVHGEDFFSIDLIDAIGQHATQHIEELVLLDASDVRCAHNWAFFYVFDFIFICLFVVFIILNINMCIWYTHVARDGCMNVRTAYAVFMNSRYLCCHTIHTYRLPSETVVVLG